jgi:hypothetical protein
MDVGWEAYIRERRGGGPRRCGCGAVSHEARRRWHRGKTEGVSPTGDSQTRGKRKLRGLGVGSAEVDVGEPGARLVRWRGEIWGCGAV